MAQTTADATIMGGETRQYPLPLIYFQSTLGADLSRLALCQSSESFTTRTRSSIGNSEGLETYCAYPWPQAKTAETKNKKQQRGCMHVGTAETTKEYVVYLLPLFTHRNSGWLAGVK